MFPFQLAFLGGLLALCIIFLVVFNTVQIISERRAARKQAAAVEPGQGPVKRAA